jgi:hypothetical protein
MAGYSNRSLVDKLGIKPGMRIAIINPPRGYRSSLGQLPPGVRVSARAQGPVPFIHFFTPNRALLREHLGDLLEALEPDGALWISWPKKSSGVPTDMTEDAIREIALPMGLVDIKVAAIDDVWSGLKLVRRRANRRLQSRGPIAGNPVAL